MDVWRLFLSVLCLLPLGACGGSAGKGDGTPYMCVVRDPGDVVDGGSCEALTTDYAQCVDDSWAACASDSGEYSRIQESISTVARVQAFEEIATLLFDPKADPSAMDFLSARAKYQEDEGLDSRVVRRYDPHVDVPEGTDCSADGVPAMFPDYCVGPARLQPLILDALNAGYNDGNGASDPRVQAARVEAGLLWFLYVSTYKEGLTCTTKAKDCDSAYAYYTGGETDRGGIGLAGRVRSVSAYAHDRAWDGLLALRCWRDLDSGEVAGDLTLRELARDQLDRAVLFGLATVVRDRIYQYDATTGSEQDYHRAFVQTLAPSLYREAQAQSAADAMAFEAEISKLADDTVDVPALLSILDRVFDCP